MKDRTPKQYESVVKYGYSSLKEKKGTPVRAHVGTKKGKDVDYTKTVYRYYETVRKTTGVLIPKPLFGARVYIAEKRASERAFKLNRRRT